MVATVPLVNRVLMTCVTGTPSSVARSATLTTDGSSIAPCRGGAGGGGSCGFGGASLEGLELAAPSAARLTGAVGGA